MKITLEFEDRGDVRSFYKIFKKMTCGFLPNTKNDEDIINSVEFQLMLITLFDEYE